MVPVFTGDGTLMAYYLHPDPLDILQGWYPGKAIPRQYLGNMQAIPPQNDMNEARSGHDNVLNFSLQHKDGSSWASQLLFFNQKTKKMATEKPKGVSPDRIQNDPNFERTRENMAEFGRAGKAASLIREIFRDVTIFAKDKVTQARLLKVLKRVLLTDPVNDRGARTVQNGDPQQLKGFNFNNKAALRETLYVRCPVTIDRAAGQATIAIPALVPRIMVQAPGGTTHYRIVAGVTTVNFDTEVYTYQRASTDELPWDHVLAPATDLSLTFPANSPETIILAMGIEFSQKVNNQSYALKTGECNATTIVAVSKP